MWVAKSSLKRKKIENNAPQKLILELRKVLQKFPTVAQYHQIIAIRHRRLHLHHSAVYAYVYTHAQQQQHILYTVRPLLEHQRTHASREKKKFIHKDIARFRIAFYVECSAPASIIQQRTLNR